MDGSRLLSDRRGFLGGMAASLGVLPGLAACHRGAKGLVLGDQVKTAVLCPSYVSTNISQCYRTRPADFANDSGPTKSQLATQAISAKDLANGSLTPAEVASITFQAIEAGQFYIYPSPELLPIVKNRLDHIVDGSNPAIPYDDIPMFKERRDRLKEALAS